MCVEGNGVCIAVCIVLGGMLGGAMHEIALVNPRGVLGTVFWNVSSTLKQYFVLPKNGSNYYLMYTLLAFSVLGILGLGTPLVDTLRNFVPCRHIC